MDGFEKRRQQKKEQIFAAALELLAKSGPQKPRIDEIARQARVSPATIYNYFGTKEELYRQTLHAWLDSKEQDYEEILQSDLPFKEKVRQVLFHEGRNINLLAQLGPEAAGAVTAILAEAEGKLHHFYLALIEEGRKEDCISGSYSEAALERYFRIFFREINQLIDSREKSNIEEEIEQLLNLFFYGLVSEEK